MTKRIAVKDAKTAAKTLPYIKKGNTGIQTTEPLKHLQDVQKVKNYLLRQSFRNYLLATMLFNTGLRATDVLALRVKDVLTDTITIRERKTGKLKRYSINGKLRQDIDLYIEGKQEAAYLFASRKGDNKPLDRASAYSILQGAVDALHIPVKLGLHGCRKTYAYQLYRATNDLMLVSHALNHTNPATTRIYIGLTDEELQEATTDFYL